MDTLKRAFMTCDKKKRKTPILFMLFLTIESVLSGISIKRAGDRYHKIPLRKTMGRNLLLM